MTKECKVGMKFLFLKGKAVKEICDGMSVTLNTKNFPTRQLKTGWLDLWQDIAVLKMAIQEGHLWSVCLKMWMLHYLGRTKKFSQKYSGDCGNILGMCRVHRPWCVGHETIWKMGARCLNVDQKRDCVVASQAILEHFRQNTASFLVQLGTMDEVDTFVWSRDTRTI